VGLGSLILDGVSDIFLQGYGTACAAEGKGGNRSHDDYFHMHGDRCQDLTAFIIGESIFSEA
jgi:hypothetical protein